MNVSRSNKTKLPIKAMEKPTMINLASDVSTSFLLFALSHKETSHLLIGEDKYILLLLMCNVFLLCKQLLFTCQKKRFLDFPNPAIGGLIGN